jgi:transcriptional regulator with XRE-family HTH domain
MPHRSRHVEALLLHAANREQYPRFYRGRYRLAMSLEMLANPDCVLDKTDMTTLEEALRILGRCGVPDANAGAVIRDGRQVCLPDGPRSHLLAAAQQELHEIQRYLTWRHIIWASFRYRNERAVLSPYRHPRHRQAFHDGVRVAQLLVAVRQALMPVAKEGDKRKPRHASTIARIAAAISGDSSDFKHLHLVPVKTARQQPITTRLRTRRLPWQYSTPSWPAAYNLACAYAALAAHPDAKTQLDPLVSKDAKTQLNLLVSKVARSLEFAICNPECEMERPSEWIGNDPDFRRLSGGGNRQFMAFLRAQRQLSLTDLGQALGRYLGRPWSRQAVHQAERGQRSFTAAELTALALALDTSVQVLFRAETAQIELPGLAVSPEQYRGILLNREKDAPLDGVEEMIIALHDIGEVLSRPALARLARIGRAAEQAAGPGQP